MPPEPRWSPPGRIALFGLVLLALTLAAEAQGRGGRRGGKGGGKGARPGAEAADGERPAPETKEFLPGFNTPPESAAKPKASKTPAQPPKPKPPDPMSEADAVTGAADHQARRAAAEEQLLNEHFRLCDLDDNGWVSLREATAALAIDRVEYRRLDANQDGRLDAGEFERDRANLLARLGALPELTGGPEPEPPVPPEPSTPSAPPTEVPPTTQPSASPSGIGAMSVKPGAFLRRYDGDGSGGLGSDELESALAEGGWSLSAAQALEVLDRNDTGQLEAGELFPFAWLASKSRPAPPSSLAASEPAPTAEAATTLEPAAPPAQPTDTNAPDLGSHFARLDPGHDGFIDEADLRSLQSPARLDLRTRAVLSALDRDGDGRLSEAEFQAALGAGRR